MSGPVWLRRLRLPSSPPEPSSAAGRLSGPDTPDSFDPAPAHRGVAASARSAARRLRPVLAAALLSLPLLAGLPDEASAQTAPACTTANSGGAYLVPADWALTPSGLAAGTKFRLLFVTSTTRNATATGIATYNTYVQTRAKAGHSAISDSCGNLFKVVGSTSAVDARDNTGTTGTGVRIYWLNGNKLADNYADFYDNTWDDYTVKNEHGNTAIAGDVWTGSNTNGTKRSTEYLGASHPSTGFPDGVDSPLNSGSTDSSQVYSFYGLSPVFEVAPPRIDSSTINEGQTKTFTVTGIPNSWTGTVETTFTGSGTSPAAISSSCPQGGLSSGVDACVSSVSWNSARRTFTFTIYALPDADTNEGDETFTVRIQDSTDTTRNAEFTITIKNRAPADAAFRIHPVKSDGTADTANSEVSVPETAGKLVFRVQHARPYQFGVGHAITFNYYVSDAKQGKPGWHARTGYHTAVLPAYKTSVDVEVPIRANNEGPAGDNRVTVTLMAGNGYIGLNNYVYYNIEDGPDAELEVNHIVSVKAGDRGTGRTEGESVPFEIRLDGPKAAQVPFTVHLKVEESGGGDFVAAEHEGHKTVRFEHGQSWAAFEVPTVKDGQREPDSRVTVSLADTAGNVPTGDMTVTPGGRGTYFIFTAKIVDFNGVALEHRPVNPPYVSPPSASVTVVDVNPPGVSFATASHEVQEDAGTVDLTVAVQPPSPSSFDLSFFLSGTATRGYGRAAEDYTVPGVRGSNAGTVTVPANAASVTIPVTITDDNVDDDGETITLRLLDSGDYRATAPASVTLTISNDDPEPDPQAVDALPAAHPVVKYAALVKAFYDRIGARHRHGNSAISGWNKRFLKAMGHPEYVNYPRAAVTVSDATRLWNHGGPGANTAWNGTVEAVTYAEQYFAGLATAPQEQQTPDPAPAAGIALPGTAAAPLSNGAVTLARPSAWTGSGKVQFGGGSKTRDRGKFTGLRIRNADNDGFEVAWTSREAGTLRLTLEWQPMAGSSWRPSDGDARDPHVLTIEDPAATQPATTTDPAPVPEIAIAAGSGITEGGSATFTLTAAPAPAAPLEVTVTIAATGAFGVAAGERTVTIPTTGSYTLTLATLGDGTDEPDGSVSVTVKAGTGYTVGSASSGTVAIADDDLPPPEISVSGGAGITEGQNAVFTVTADRAVDAGLAVTLKVTEKAGSDFVAAADEGGRTVTIPAGGTSASLTVKTVDDAVDEPDGSVTATLAAGGGYRVAAPPADAASVAVADNDAAALGPPVISVEDVTVREGGIAAVPVRLSPAPTESVWLIYKSVYAPVGAGKLATPADFRLMRSSLHFGAGETLKYARVPTKQDSHDDGGEVFQVMVVPVRGGAVPATGVFATVTIENDDPMPAAYLARFGRTVAEQALDGIAGRMAADRTPGMRGTVAGQALSLSTGSRQAFDPDASGPPAAGAAPGAAGTPGATPVDRQAALAMAEIARGLGADASAPVSAPAGPGGAADRFGGGHGLGESRTMTARDALLGSSFSLTGQRDGAGGSLAFWGRASQGSFDGAERGDGTDITLDGTVTTGMLGADYARGNWLVGLALTQSTSDGKYAAIGGGDEGDGKVEASLTAAIPYAALRASERLKLWGAAGYGAGEVTLKTALGESLSADASWTMAAAGARGDLLEAPAEGSGPALALTSDALWARTSSEKGDLPATDSDVTRLRLGLEGSYRIAMEGDSHLIPKLEVGARHDGGDAETGFGVEVGGGIAWVDPSLGLSLDLSGRTLLAHENDDLKDRGFSAALGFDPAPATRRGPSLSLRQDFGGQAQGGLDALFNTAPLEDRSGSEATSRWALEAAYGLPVFGDRFTGSPHVGFGLSTAARDYSLGWRLTPEAATAPDLSFGIRATRRESDAAEAEHSIGFEFTSRW